MRTRTISSTLQLVFFRMFFYASAVFVTHVNGYTASCSELRHGAGLVPGPVLRGGREFYQVLRGGRVFYQGLHGTHWEGLRRCGAGHGTGVGVSSLGDVVWT